MKTNLSNKGWRSVGFLFARTKHLTTIALAIGVAVVAIGCGSTSADRTAGQSIDDRAISRRVQEALSADPAYKFGDVKVTTYEGKVQLGGFVDRGEQKGQAEDIAKKIPGVKEVKNDITMKK
jgi:hyperosmotically inducible periplasmic protein